MQLPLALPLSPMLARSATAVPEPGSVEGGWSYEPKWDGFRCLLARDGDEVELFSRGKKPLTRYFPEVVQLALTHLPERCVVDGELVVRSGQAGAEHLDWEALSQRIHPAVSRITQLATTTPAELVAFDLLCLGDRDLTDLTRAERREALEGLFAELDSPGLHLTRTTEDVELARTWFRNFEGAGLDGVVCKQNLGRYEQGKRTMVKVKHKRTAEAVVVGYRMHTSGRGVGSLLLGMVHEGEMVRVGGIGAFTRAMRDELVDLLEPLVVRDPSGQPMPLDGPRSRFAKAGDPIAVAVDPSLVVEVAFDQLEGNRFRHAAQFLRWRPDRDPENCLLAQVDRPIGYDLAEVLVG